MHDKDNLYVGFEGLDQNPKKLISNSRYLPDGDAVFLVLDTFHDGLADYCAQLTGLILMRATHQNITQLLQSEIWDPLGMLYGGSWSIDSKEDNLEQMAVGLNVPAIDYARFGLLYLQNGTWCSV